jgi:pimeloyl-ACP methyl ester carboxylesterase
VLVGLDGSPGWQAGRAAVVAVVTTALVSALRRLSPGASGWLAVVASVPALAVSAGFAPHWVKGGPLPVQVAAAVLAAAGLGLAVGGTVVATRGRRWWRRAASGAGVVLAAAVVALVAGPAVAATNVPRPPIGATPARAGLAYQDVRLHTADGVALAAWYVPSADGATVVLLHGAGSTRSDVLDQAAVIARAGFGVLMLDARGHGESGGRAMDFGWFGDEDIAAATAFLEARPDVEPGRIGLVGLSMGGEQAIGASATDERVRAVVAEGATARSALDEAWLSDHYGVRGLFQEQLEWAQDRVTDALTSAPVPTSGRAAVAASGRTRYLLITAGTIPDEGHAAAYVAAAAPGRVETWTVVGSGHTGGLDTAPDEWATRVVGFLRSALR